MSDFDTQLASAQSLAAQYKATVDEQNEIIRLEQAAAASGRCSRIIIKVIIQQLLTIIMEIQREIIMAAIPEVTALLVAVQGRWIESFFLVHQSVEAM